MIQIKPLASGSAGNCYYITDGRSPLLIEAGIPIKKIKQGLNYKLSEIEGCLISHEHL
jgi:phosphoribosyl 1,2-cyclic phosphodiesterase